MKYYFDYKAIREPLKQVSIERYKRGRSGHTKYTGQKIQHKGIDAERKDFLDFDQQFRRKRDVWEVSTNNYKVNEHFAMYPEKLIEPCVLAGSRLGGIVLDPFFGSGECYLPLSYGRRRWTEVTYHGRFACRPTGTDACSIGTRIRCALPTAVVLHL